jgi:hypothetical protein
MVRAVNAASSLDEALDIIGQYSTGYVGGRQGSGRVAVLVTINGKFVVGARQYETYVGRTIYGLASREEIRNNLETLRVSIQAGVEPEVLQQANEQTAEALKQKLAQLIQLDDQTQFAYEEPFLAPGVPVDLATGVAAYTRETILPITRLEEARGQDLLLSREQLAAIGLDDNAIERLIRRMEEVDRDRDIGFTNIERFRF